ncbi:hypothetical protein GCM10028808_45360 [Spirosoma migulaei]
MKHPLLNLSLILAGLVGCAAYGWLLLDWVQDMKTGNYDSDPLEAVCQAIVILAYCYLAYHFIDSRVTGSIRSQDPKINPMQPSRS